MVMIRTRLKAVNGMKALLAQTGNVEPPAINGLLDGLPPNRKLRASELLLISALVLTMIILDVPPFTRP